MGREERARGSKILCEKRVECDPDVLLMWCDDGIVKSITILQQMNKGYSPNKYQILYFNCFRSTMSNKQLAKFEKMAAKCLPASSIQQISGLSLVCVSQSGSHYPYPRPHRHPIILFLVEENFPIFPAPPFII